MKHKFLVITLGLAFVVPAVVSAQVMTVAQLQLEIQSLTSQLQSLQQRLAISEGQSSATWCYSFNNNLSIGASGSSVTALQTALQKDGESVTVNGTFDAQTAAAVTSFQEKYRTTVLAPNGLTNGTGYVGRSTRAELNSIFGCGGSVSESTAAPSLVPVGVHISCDPIPAGCTYVGGTATSCGTLVCNSIAPSTVPVPTSTSTSATVVPPATSYISENQAIAIVLARAGVTTSTYQVSASFQGGDWYVNVSPDQPTSTAYGMMTVVSGGNSSYVVDGTTGVILSVALGQ
jgi:peptidoglycan hydrolase-like protein with peptidoglycan-binding domain